MSVARDKGIEPLLCTANGGDPMQWYPYSVQVLCDVSCSLFGASSAEKRVEWNATL